MAEEMKPLHPLAQGLLHDLVDVFPKDSHTRCFLDDIEEFS